VKLEQILAIVVVLALVLVTGAAYAVRTHFVLSEEQPYGAAVLGDVDANLLHSAPRQVSGEIRGLEVDRIQPWYATLQVHPASGDDVYVIVNRYSSVPISRLAPVESPDVGDFDDALVGMRFSGVTRMVRRGPLWLDRGLVVEEGAIQRQ